MKLSAFNLHSKSYLGDRRTPGTGPLLLPKPRKPCQDIPLTANETQTNVNKMCRSRVPASQERGPRLSALRVCVPILLIGLLLYNPFLALASHSEGLTYQALARHRATVGASEMQHFASMQGENAQPEATVDKIFPEFVVKISDVRSHLFQEEVSLPRPGITASLWFRPPPKR